MEWEFPLMRLAPELNPDVLRRPQAKNKVCTDREFVEAVLGDSRRNFGTIVREAEHHLQRVRPPAVDGWSGPGPR